MNPEYIGKSYTLDWDNIDEDVCLRRLQAIKETHQNTKKLCYRRSPSKNGYHILGFLHGNAVIPRLRYQLGDDPRRLLNDIFNRPDHIFDVLWDRKIIQGKVYKAGKWKEYHGEKNNNISDNSDDINNNADPVQFWSF